jgi:DNA-binding response OmpR family regulator
MQSIKIERGKAKTSKKPKILVVDDEPHIVRMIKLAVEDKFEVVEAYSALEAIKKARIEKPDLITVDVMMPNTDGLTLCKKFRKIPSTKDIPIMVISAKDSIQDKIAGIDAGAIDYLEKPFKIEELNSKIANNINAYKWWEN